MAARVHSLTDEMRSLSNELNAAKLESKAKDENIASLEKMVANMREEALNQATKQISATADENSKNLLAKIKVQN